MRDFTVDGPVYLGEFIEMCKRVMRPYKLFDVDLRDIHGALTDRVLKMDNSEVERYYNYKIVDADFDEDYYCFNFILLSPDELEG